MSEMESELPTRAFVRQELVAERAAPIKTTGLVGFLRTRLFNSPTNILLTIGGILLLWFTVVPSVKFLLIDAVWTGKDRTACLVETVGRPVGADQDRRSRARDVEVLEAHHAQRGETGIVIG